MASANTQRDLPVDCNFDDATDMHSFQLAVQNWCENAAEDENFISEEDAERDSKLLVHPNVWPSVMFSMPALTVKMFVLHRYLLSSS